MIRNSKKINKRKGELTERFAEAYMRLSINQRRAARVAFASYFGVAEGTFSNKLSGANGVFQTEVEWMESYQPQKATTATA